MLISSISTTQHINQKKHSHIDSIPRGSLLSWGFPLLMVAVAAAFKYNDHEHEHAVELTDPLVITALDPEHNCWYVIDRIEYNTHSRVIRFRVTPAG